MKRFVGVVMLVMGAGAVAHADDAVKTLATLDVPLCTVKGVIGDAVVVDADTGVIFVPRDGGAPRNVYGPPKRDSRADRFSALVLGGHLMYDQTKYDDNGSSSREFLGVIDAQKQQATELAEPVRNWAMTADDRYLYWADVGSSVAETSAVYRVPLGGGAKERAFDVPGRVQQLAAYKGTLYATTLTEAGHGALGSTKMCFELHRQQGKRSKALWKCTSDRHLFPDGDTGGLAVSGGGVYFLAGQILRRLPLAGGKETRFGEARSLDAWSDGSVVVWKSDDLYFVADAGSKQLAPRKVKEPGPSVAHYAVSGDHIFWSEHDDKHCTIKRATLE